MSEPAPKSRKKRMSGKQRREQLLDVGRRLFAERGFDGTSIEEVAAQADVSKPVVYEHFGGKEGLYAVVVDREMQTLLSTVVDGLGNAEERVKIERAAIALLTYIDENSDGFRILVRDRHAAAATGTFASLISDIASQVEYILAENFKQRGYDPKLAPMYAQMLVGMVAVTGQWWLDERRPKREVVAAHLINLAWNGLRDLEPEPQLVLDSPEYRREEREREKQERREEKRSRKERKRDPDPEVVCPPGSG